MTMHTNCDHAYHSFNDTEHDFLLIQSDIFSKHLHLCLLLLIVFFILIRGVKSVKYVYKKEPKKIKIN